MNATCEIRNNDKQCCDKNEFVMKCEESACNNDCNVGKECKATPACKPACSRTQACNSTCPKTAAVQSTCAPACSQNQGANLVKLKRHHHHDTYYDINGGYSGGSNANEVIVIDHAGGGRHHSRHHDRHHTYYDTNGDQYTRYRSYSQDGPHSHIYVNNNDLNRGYSRSLSADGNPVTRIVLSGDPGNNNRVQTYDPSISGYNNRDSNIKEVIIVEGKNERSQKSKPKFELIKEDFATKTTTTKSRRVYEKKSPKQQRNVEIVLRQDQPQNACAPACPQQPVCAPVCPQQPVCAPVCPQQPVCAPVCPQQPVCAPVCPQQPVCAPICPPQQAAQPCCQQTCEQPMADCCRSRSLSHHCQHRHHFRHCRHHSCRRSGCDDNVYLGFDDLDGDCCRNTCGGRQSGNRIILVRNEGRSRSCCQSPMNQTCCNERPQCCKCNQTCGNTCSCARPQCQKCGKPKTQKCKCKQTCGNTYTCKCKTKKRFRFCPCLRKLIPKKKDECCE